MIMYLQGKTQLAQKLNPKDYQYTFFWQTLEPIYSGFFLGGGTIKVAKMPLVCNKTRTQEVGQPMNATSFYTQLTAFCGIRCDCCHFRQNGFK